MYLCIGNMITCYTNKHFIINRKYTTHTAMSNTIITLTTDWGYSDFFSAKVKGLIHSNLDNVQVIDITHGITPFDSYSAAFIIRNCYADFPKGTIHIIDTNGDNNDPNDNLIVEAHNQYFICPNNILPSVIFGNKIEHITRIKSPYTTGNSFMAYTLLAPTAIMLARGKKPSELGEEIKSLPKIASIDPILEGDRLTLYILYIDHYGNAYLNITLEEFNKICGDRRFEFTVKDHKINQIQEHYNQYSNSQNSSHLQIGIIPSVGTHLLQIAINKLSAQRLMGLKTRERVIVNFK